MRFKESVLFVSICAVSSLANAETPTTGLVHNTREASSITYNCGAPDASGLMACEFTQASVRKKAKPEELAKKLQEATEEYKNKKGELLSGECESLDEMTAIFDGRKPAPDKNKFDSMTEKQKSDYRNVVAGMAKACKSKSLSDYLDVIRISHDIDVRTCTVSTNAFKQSFKRVGFDKEANWVSQSAPEGPCGTVQLCRFEADKSEVSEYSFFNYVAKKAITNPNAELYQGLKCSDMDQSEYLYSWKSETREMSCDYVEFSVL